MIHDVAYFAFYNNDDQPGWEESTIVGLEKAAPWESRHIPITTHGQFTNALNEAIALREKQLKYLNGLRTLAQYIPFTQLRADAEKRGGLIPLVDDFWRAYDED